MEKQYILSEEEYKQYMMDKNELELIKKNRKNIWIRADVFSLEIKYSQNEEDIIMDDDLPSDHKREILEDAIREGRFSITDDTRFSILYDDKEVNF